MPSRIGGVTDLWSIDTEHALLAAADEVVDTSVVGDETWRALAASFGPDQLLEILFVIGGYLCMAAVLNTVGLQADPPPAPDPS